MTAHEKMDLRKARRSDVSACLAVIRVADQAALLAGPFAENVRSMAPGDERTMAIDLHSPVGHLGYRYAVIAEISGEAAGFAIRQPLSRLRGPMLGPILPEAVAVDRFGDLSKVLDIYMLCVAPAFRADHTALKLLVWCLDEAALQGYRHVMTQMWRRNRASFEGARYCGFRPFHQSEHALADGGRDAFVFVDRPAVPLGAVT